MPLIYWENALLYGSGGGALLGLIIALHFGSFGSGNLFAFVLATTTTTTATFSPINFAPNYHSFQQQQQQQQCGHCSLMMMPRLIMVMRLGGRV